MATIVAFLPAPGLLVVIVHAWRSFRGPRNAPPDPWGARRYEWMPSSPPKAHNFDAVPVVHTIDEFFHRKYAEDEETGKLRQVATAEEILAEQEAHADHHIHTPSPSYCPLVVSARLPIVALGLIYNHVISVIGAVVILLGVYGWAQEPSVADDEDADPPEGPGGESKELATIG